MGLGKVLVWLFLLLIIGYVVFSIMEGQKAAAGKTYYHPYTGSEAKVLKFDDCMDTDGGKNYKRQGTTYNIQDGLEYDDYCENSETLVEYFCNNQYPDRMTISCNCLSGICI